MIPKDDLRLGWPGTFPGSYEVPPGSDPKQTFDVVAHHAVFNYTTMLSYVPNAIFVTIIREPVNQFTSAWCVRISLLHSLLTTPKAQPKARRCRLLRRPLTHRASSTQVLLQEPGAHVEGEDHGGRRLQRQRFPDLGRP